MTIKVYPSTLSETPIEVHGDWGITIGQWFDSKGLDRSQFEMQPVSVKKNGVLVDPADWDDTEINQGDSIDVYAQPHGGVFKAVGSLVGGVFKFLFGWVMPSSKTPRYGSPERGNKIEPSEARANTARMGEVVPELAGRHIKYPDYLNQPRRYFRNRREQWLEFLCCIGPGRYQILDEEVRVGDTTFDNLGDDGSYQIYEPNADLSGNPIHENWHTVDEVGGTSSGTAGLELVVDPARRNHTDIPPEYVFSGNTITIPEGTGSFPPGWGPGTIIRVTLTMTKIYAVTGGGVPLQQPNVFTGDFSHLMPIANGTLLTFTSGPLVGTYMAQAVSLDASGVGSMQLWVPGAPGDEHNPPVDPEPVSHLSPGSYNMTSVGVHDRTLLGSSEELVTYAGEALLTYTGPATIAFAGGTVYGEWSSTFAACPAGELTERFEVDFFFPQGLGYIKDDGNISNRSVTVEIQYRDADTGGPFTSIVKTYSARTLDQIGFTESFSVSSMRPEVRVRRVGSQSTSTQVQDTVQWYALRSRLPTVTRYPNWTVMAVRLRSGGRMSAQSENQVNVIATRILPELNNGQWSVPVPTRDISAFVKYIASTIGYTDDNFHIEELRRLNQVWRQRGETLDFVFSESTVKSVLDVAFGAGMAELTVSDGRIKPVREGVRTTFETEQGYSAQNMTSPLVRRFKSRAHDDPDAVEVEFMDETNWEKNTVLCTLPGDQAFKVERLRVDGVVDRTRAWRIGMRYRAQLKYRRWEYRFSTELDAMNSEYMSYVPIIDDMPGYGRSALLEHIEPYQGKALLHISEPVEWEEGASHVVAYRRPDGTVAGPFPAQAGDDEFQVIADIPQPWPEVSLRMELPHIYFGVAQRWCFPALITSIRPNSDGTTVDVEAQNYDSRIYDYDDESPAP